MLNVNLRSVLRVIKISNSEIVKITVYFAFPDCQG